MLNVSGHLTEGTISNVFFYQGGIVCTPSIQCGILDGITRGIVLDLAVREGYIVREGEFTRDDIYHAAEVFITNTSLEIMPVSSVDAVKYKVGAVSKLLHETFRKEVRAYVSTMKGSGPSLWGSE